MGRHNKILGRLAVLAALLALERLAPAVVLANGFTISGGTVTISNSAQITTISDLVINNGSLTANNSQIIIGGNWTNSGGSFTPGTSTVTLNSTASGKTITSKGSPFYNLFFNGSGGYWTLQDSMTVLSTATITAGTLDTNSLGSNRIALSGGWLNNGGTFVVNHSTVTFTGNTAQVIRNAGQRFEILVDSNTSPGGVVFASSFTAVGLSINGAGLASATTVYFNAGSTYTISGLSMIGSSGKTVWARSSIDGQSWYLNNVSTNNVSYVDVKDSNANGGQTIAAGPRSLDSTHNANWTFLILSISLSPLSYDFGPVQVASASVTTSALVVTNTGNDTETYSLSVSTVTPSVWTVGTSTPTSYNQFALFAKFNSVQPSSTTFHPADIVIKTPTSSTAQVYALNQSGLQTSPASPSNLWLFLTMPLTVSTTAQQTLDLTVSATNP